ncbi:MAG TPA: glycerate kinase [Acidimicrobiales bacterium]|nr:glycerate kinase [Acidimicrobiales bacterium]
MRSLLVAPDKFRSSASAPEVASAIARAAISKGWTSVQAPISDGGEGFLDVLAQALNASRRSSYVTGPMGNQVEAAWAVASGNAGTTEQVSGIWRYLGDPAKAGKIAIIEMARASGLELAGGPSKNSPMDATSRGTGELISLAVSSGAGTVVIGCGGSATTDGGAPAIEALRPYTRLKGVRLVVACDVECKFSEAAERFSRQKGASEAQVRLLTRRLEALAKRYLDEFGVHVEQMSGAGAAGGLAGGLAAVGAHLVPGFDLISDLIGLESMVESADLVITGEGCLDEESFNGKALGSMANLASKYGKPVLAVVGDNACQNEKPPAARSVQPDGLAIISLTEMYGPERSKGDVLGCVEEAVADFLDTF